MIDNYNHFSVIVAGNNPDDLMKKYDNNVKVEPYVVYKYSDAESLLKKYIDIYEKILENNKNTNKAELIKDEIDFLKAQDPIDFYADITEGYEYDENTGDAISTVNPNGKWRIYNIGKNLSIPFILKNSKNECFSALKGDIDWDLIHMSNKEIYENTWDMIINGKAPTNENEQLIYENMKERFLYFQSFKNKENYVASNSAFWAYAFLDENNWYEMEDNIAQLDWITNYYDRFIKPLPDNTKLTIFECVK